MRGLPKCNWRSLGETKIYPEMETSPDTFSIELTTKKVFSDVAFDREKEEIDSIYDYVTV